LNDWQTQSVFDDTLFDHMCSLLYNYKALSLLRPEVGEHSVMPLLSQVMSACSKSSILWVLDLERNREIVALSPNVLPAFDFHPEKVPKVSLSDVPQMQGMFHREDINE
ncbi:unnamed protein product, partial [Phaeothamnion confervicola]